MKKLTKRNEKTNLEKEIDGLLAYMASIEQTSDEYMISAGNLTELYSARVKEQELERKERISPDALISVAGNLLGIILILSHEKVNVITTKALGFVMRSRV